MMCSKSTINRHLAASHTSTTSTVVLKQGHFCTVSLGPQKNVKCMDAHVSSHHAHKHTRTLTHEYLHIHTPMHTLYCSVWLKS